MCKKDTANKVLPIFFFFMNPFFFFDEKFESPFFYEYIVTFEQFKVFLLSIYYFILKHEIEVMLLTITKLNPSHYKCMHCLCIGNSCLLCRLIDCLNNSNLDLLGSP